jgi:SLT domain-containing protein
MSGTPQGLTREYRIVCYHAAVVLPLFRDLVDAVEYESSCTAEVEGAPRLQAIRYIRGTYGVHEAIPYATKLQAAAYALACLVLLEGRTRCYMGTAY